MIKTFTITGADESVSPQDLISLQKAFPFVEWGILVSRKNFGRPRFPSMDWIQGLLDQNLRLSVHLCGAYVRELLTGNLDFIEEIEPLFLEAKRVQINTHGIPHMCYHNRVFNFVSGWGSKEFIFQFDNANAEILHYLVGYGLKNVSTLFDLSHGAGVLPDQWPEPIPLVKCGYAGGLSPHNLSSQIDIIESIVGDTETWIDMETHVRSQDDALFDISKVVTCLDILSLKMRQKNEKTPVE